MLGWGLVMLSHRTVPVTLGNHSNHLTVWVTTVGILWLLWFAPALPVTGEETDAGSRPLQRPCGGCFWLHPTEILTWSQVGPAQEPHDRTW